MGGNPSAIRQRTQRVSPTHPLAKQGLLRGQSRGIEESVCQRSLAECFHSSERACTCMQLCGRALGHEGKTDKHKALVSASCACGRQPPVGLNPYPGFRNRRSWKCATETEFLRCSLNIRRRVAPYPTRRRPPYVSFGFKLKGLPQVPPRKMRQPKVSQALFSKPRHEFAGETNQCQIKTKGQEAFGFIHSQPEKTHPAPSGRRFFPLRPRRPPLLVGHGRRRGRRAGFGVPLGFGAWFGPWGQTAIRHRNEGLSWLLLGFTDLHFYPIFAMCGFVVEIPPLNC